MRSGTTSIAPAVFLFLFGWLASTAAAQAQYPSRMVRAIVPYTPGSSADLIARNLGPRLSEGWKVPFLVDNRAGASGIIGVQAVVAAPADGYTVLVMADNFASAASVRPNSYDPVNDLDPVILLARGDYALMASASFPAKSVAEVVVTARGPRQTPRRHRSAPEGPGGGRAHVEAGNDARRRNAGGAARSHPVGLRALDQDRARSRHQGGLIMQKAAGKAAEARRDDDPFENHCWKDIMPPDVIKLYSNYRREVGVGPSPALIAIDLYELVYQGGAKPVPQVMKAYPNSCGEYAWAAIAPTKRLLAAARAAGLPVFYSTGDTRPQSQPKNVRATRRQGVYVDRELYAIRPEFKPAPDEIGRASCRERR